MMTEPRTLRDFVEDLMSEGHSLDYVLTVALASRWSPEQEEIKKIYKSIRKK